MNGWTMTLAVLGGAAVLGFLAARLGRCHHSSPGLLPPTTQDDGTRLGARWFCDSCGHTWPAGFERDTRPVVRYQGYDESKAIAAARRADTLAKQQRGLAL